MAEGTTIPHRFRMIIAALCIAESLLFGGLFFGWASLVYILKQEGLYSFLCESQFQNDTVKEIDVNRQPFEYNDHLKHSNVSNEGEDLYIHIQNPDVLPASNYSVIGFLTCKQQDAKLNLWFTIAVSVLSLTTSLIGWLLYRFGPKILRCVGSFTFCSGALMLAFVNNDVPWLICPGLFSVAFGAVCISAANLQVVPFLFDRGSSVAVSLLTGFYYSAATTQWLIKVAFENGISRQHSYIFLTALNVILVTGNTILFFRQPLYPDVELSVAVSDEVDTAKQRDAENEKFLLKEMNENKVVNQYDGHAPHGDNYLVEKVPAENEENVGMLAASVPDDVLPPLRSCIFNRTFLFHLFWFVTNDFYLITFIGISNAMMERILERDVQKVNHFTDIFSFSLMCAAIFSVVGGFLYDCQRMVFRERKSLQRQFLPAVFPITIATILGAITVGLQFFRSEVMLYPLFVLFVIYKQCVFAMTFSFIVDVYPRQYFGVFYGIVFTVAGIVLFLQYALFTWIAAGPYSPNHVNLFLLCLVLASLVNPINLLIQGLQSLGD